METIGKVWNSRCLRVVGHFRIYLLKKDRDPHPLWVTSQAELADKTSPWVPINGDECSPRILNCIKRDGVIDFELHPQFEIYPRQLYAFHRYLCGIAENLANQNQEIFAQVNVFLEMNAEVTAFRTPAGVEIYNLAESAVTKAITDLSK